MGSQADSQAGSGGSTADGGAIPVDRPLDAAPTEAAFNDAASPDAAGEGGSDAADDLGSLEAESGVKPKKEGGREGD
jgi:hypothetical protein